MSAPPVIVVGAGGHASVVADALLAAGRSVIGFIDPVVEKHGRFICGLPVVGGDDYLDRCRCSDIELINGIGGVGDTLVRERVQQRLQNLGWRFTGVRHPSATASPFAEIAPDTQLLAHAVVQANASIEAGCIVNSGAIVEHDVTLGAWSHVSPGAVICGEVRLGEGCHIGAGAVVIQGIQLGPRTLIGAGATVVKNFDGYGTLIGVPARKVGG